MYFLLGNCKFGSIECVYAHDKTYLQTGRWWEDEGKCLMLRYVMNSLHPAESPAFMPYMFGLIDDRLAWASAHGVEMEEVFGHSRAQSLQTFRDAVDIGLTTACLSNGRRGGPPGGRRGGGQGRAGGSGGNIGRGGTGQIHQFDDEDEWESESLDEETQERMNNYGFTEDEVMELLAQGVKPWDDDAWVSVPVCGLPSALLTSVFRLFVTCSIRSNHIYNLVRGPCLKRKYSKTL